MTTIRHDISAAATKSIARELDTPDLQSHEPGRVETAAGRATAERLTDVFSRSTGGGLGRLLDASLRPEHESGVGREVAGLATSPELEVGGPGLVGASLAGGLAQGGLVGGHDRVADGGSSTGDPDATTTDRSESHEYTFDAGEESAAHDAADVADVAHLVAASVDDQEAQDEAAHAAVVTGYFSGQTGGGDDRDALGSDLENPRPASGEAPGADLHVEGDAGHGTLHLAEENGGGGPLVGALVATQQGAGVDIVGVATDPSLIDRDRLDAILGQKLPEILGE